MCTLLNAQVGISADFQSSLSVEQFPPSNSSLLDHLGLSACSSQLKESAILLLGSSSLHYYLESLSRSIIGLILYLSMPDVQCLENHCFIYFGLFIFSGLGWGCWWKGENLVVLEWQPNLVPVTPSWLKVEVLLTWYFKKNKGNMKPFEFFLSSSPRVPMLL